MSIAQRMSLLGRFTGFSLLAVAIVVPVAIRLPGRLGHDP